MKLIILPLLVLTTTYAQSSKNEDSSRDKRHLVLIPHPAVVQPIVYVPVAPPRVNRFVSVSVPVPIAQCGNPAWTCQGTCYSNSVGGIPAVKGEFPWLAQIYLGNVFLCGGSIINDRFILTSADCIGSSTPESVAKLRVIVGDFKRETNQDGASVERNVTTVYRHTEFKSERQQPAKHDIALLKLTTPITFTDYIRPICLDDGSVPLDADPPNTINVEGILAGYGKIPYSTIRNPYVDTLELYKVNSRIITPQECMSHITAPVLHLKTTHICAGTAAPTWDTTVDACVGDYGGPLIVKTSPNTYTQVGIYSFGKKCGSGPPAVFTRVSSYRVWIDEVLKQK